MGSGDQALSSTHDRRLECSFRLMLKAHSGVRQQLKRELQDI